MSPLTWTLHAFVIEVMCWLSSIFKFFGFTDSIDVLGWVLLSHEQLSTNSPVSGLPCCCGILTAVQSGALVKWLSWVHRCFLELKLYDWGWLLSELGTQFLIQNSQVCVGCGWHLHKECLPWFWVFCLHGWVRNFDLWSYLNASWH